MRTFVATALFLVTGLLEAVTPAVAQIPADAEKARILAHGPWPRAWQPDPSNRVSGNADAAALGRRLFFDARLSPSGRVSCSSCHRPERGWTDGRRRGVGLVEGHRNTPSLVDVRLSRWLGWSGAGDSLWAQSLRPLLDPGEMGSSAAHVKQYLVSHSELAEHYASVFARPVATTPADDVLVDAAKALAAYQETIVSPRTAFDDFRDALAASDTAAAARYPEAARRGLSLFVGTAGCSTCHSGPRFTDGAFHITGASRGDAGRADGIERLRASPYTLHGSFNDDPARAVHWTREDLSIMGEHRGAFRTPTLRGLARMAPYMHDGRYPSLDAVLRNHPRNGLRLTPSQRAELAAFLETLNATGIKAPAGSRAAGGPSSGASTP